MREIFPDLPLTEEIVSVGGLKFEVPVTAAKAIEQCPQFFKMWAMPEGAAFSMAREWGTPHVEIVYNSGAGYGTATGVNAPEESYGYIANKTEGDRPRGWHPTHHPLTVTVHIQP